MSRKLHWADKEARNLAEALSIDSDRVAERALIASALRLAYMRGLGDVLGRASEKEKTDATV